MKRIITLLLTLSLLSFPLITSSAQLNRQAVNEPAELEEIVVTATRYKEKRTAIPAKLTIITEEEIKNSTAQFIPDILREETGLQVFDLTGNKRSYNVDIRGFGETGALNTLVLVDGRKVNNPDLSGTDWTQIPLDRVKRIEIISGGRGAVLYGDNATGGVINIITQEGEFRRIGIKVKAGSYATFKNSVYLSGSTDNLSYLFSDSYLSSSGYRKNSASEAKDLGLNLNYYPSEALKLNLSSGYHKDKTGLPGALKESNFKAGIERRDSLNPKDFARVEDYYLKAGPEINFFNNSLFKINASYRKRDSLSFSSSSFGDFSGDTELKTIAFSPQILLKEKIGRFKNSLILGFDYQEDREDIVNNSTFSGKNSFELSRKDYGYFVQEEFGLRDNLSLSGGYRHERADFKFKQAGQRKEEENLFNAGINYNFSLKSSTYLSFARSFRYPVLDEFFSFFTSSINSSLRPQTSDNYEWGVNYYFNEKASAQLNIFRLETKDEIFLNPLTFANENLVGKSRREGVETSFRLRAYPWLNLKVNYTYLKAKMKEGPFAGKDFPGVARHKLAGGPIFSFGKNFSLTFKGVYLGDRHFISDFSNNFSRQKDYFVLNTKLAYRWKLVKAFLELNNLTDLKYSEYGVLGGFPAEKAFYPSPGINFLFGLSFAL